jgi:hypothetical protein
VNRQRLVTQRLEQVTHGFAGYVEAYDKHPPFTSKQLAAHRETITMRRHLGSASAAATDRRFAASLRRTLIAWGLGVRGSILEPEIEFAQALAAAAPELAGLEPLAIDAPHLPTDVVDKLWHAIEGLGIVKNKAKIVAGTKALHHLLPDLVIPMDHVWTGTFFQLHDPEWQESQARTFRRVYGQLLHLGQQVQPEQYVTGQEWRTSRTKIIDNAVAGFCQLELTSQPPAAMTPGHQVTFDVPGYPPAKDGAQSIFGIGHDHSPRVRLLLAAAQRACREQAFVPLNENVALDVVVHAPGQPPGDATNYLGGIGDVLEDKSPRSAIEHLGDLAAVQLFRNDRQIRAISYREVEASPARYTVTVRRLADGG